MTAHVTSKDGTTLAVDTAGSGTPVILIGGAFNDRSTVAALAAALAPHFLAVTYDRRRRGGSDDRAEDYAIQNEIDDLAAVIEHVGGRASVFGHSSGAVLALSAALRGLPIDRLAVYEPPYSLDGDRPSAPADVLARLKTLLQAGDRDAAVEVFLTEAVGAPPEMVAGMKADDGWGFLVQQAESLPYDVLITNEDARVPAARLAGLSLPVLAVYGDQTWPRFLAEATKAVAAAVPDAELVAIEGEDHSILARPEVLGPPLVKFFG
jgi:pimeloyl-ACP methyl ester carboxylesterase